MTDDAAGSLATHRLRTTANLVGWAAAGAFLSAAVWFLGGLVPVLGIFSLVVGPYVAGGVIGITSNGGPLGRGRRRRGLELVVAGWLVVRIRGPVAFVGLLFISLLISVTTARYRWQLRPKALSGSSSR